MDSRNNCVPNSSVNWITCDASVDVRKNKRCEIGATRRHAESAKRRENSRRVMRHVSAMRKKVRRRNTNSK